MTRAQVIIATEFIFVLVIVLMSFHPLAHFAAATWPVKLLEILSVIAAFILIMLAVAGLAAKADRSKTLATTIRWIIAAACIMVVLTYWRGDWSLADLRSNEQPVASLSPVNELLQREEMQKFVADVRATIQNGSQKHFDKEIGVTGHIYVGLLKPSTTDLTNHIEALEFSGPGRLSPEDQQNILFAPSSMGYNHIEAFWSDGLYAEVYGFVGQYAQADFCRTTDPTYIAMDGPKYVGIDLYLRHGYRLAPQSCITGYIAVKRPERNPPYTCMVGVLGIRDYNATDEAQLVPFLVQKLTEVFNNPPVSCS